MKTDISIVAIKLYGLYLLYAFLTSLPSSFLFLSMDNESGIFPNLSVYFIVSITTLIIHLILSVIFMFKTELVLKVLKMPNLTENSTNDNFKSFALRLGIIIIGLYFLLSSLPFIIYSLIPFIPGGVKTTYSGAFWWTKYGEKFITAILAIIVILKSNSIENTLLKLTKKNSQQKNSTDGVPPQI